MTFVICVTMVRHVTSEIKYRYSKIFIKYFSETSITRCYYFIAYVTDLPIQQYCELHFKLYCYNSIYIIFIQCEYIKHEYPTIVSSNT